MRILKFAVYQLEEYLQLDLNDPIAAHLFYRKDSIQK